MRRARNAMETRPEPNNHRRQGHLSMVCARLSIHSSLRQGAVMSSKVSILKSIALTAALMAGVSGIARADDSSMNPLVGDSYAAFNGGNLPKTGNPGYDNSPSSWRQANPDGLSMRQYQSLVTFA